MDEMYTYIHMYEYRFKCKLCTFDSIEEKSKIFIQIPKICLLIQEKKT